jgi:hypothetical protein
VIGFWNWILCFAWPWHKLRVMENLSENCQRICCKRCGRQYAINHDVRVVLPWDNELEQFYREFRKP